MSFATVISARLLSDVSALAMAIDPEPPQVLRHWFDSSYVAATHQHECSVRSVVSIGSRLGFPSTDSVATKIRVASAWRFDEHGYQKRTEACELQEKARKVCVLPLIPKLSPIRQRRVQ